MRLNGTTHYVDPLEVAAVGGIYHETRAHYRDDWWFFDVFLRGGSTIRVDTQFPSGKVKAELLRAVESCADGPHNRGEESK